ncbi:hypothetical protein C8E00_103243 [Chromohalobacter marismortui]|uniref:Uncharacterized protein n=1 Tax=Chromohalobacter marismortui TaxID=42055 RepID=A0A4R7NPZ5_9GAMM|nr:hypothetical protein C8E00_103243 [Chromohalobacter marismortui]
MVSRAHRQGDRRACFMPLTIVPEPGTEGILNIVDSFE